MTTYNFEMKNLLALFNNDPEALANEFTKQLNSELNKKKALSDSKQKVVESWNSFLKTYFDIYPVPNNLKTEDFFINADEVDTLLNLILEMAPCLNNASENIKKIKETCAPVLHDISDTITDWVTRYVD